MKAIANSKECPKCGDSHKSKPFCLYENGWHCFSCGYSKSADRGFTVHDRRPLIPDWPDATNEFSKFSIEAQLWLAKFNITEDMVKEYRILYTEDNSLIFAYFEDNSLVFYQKRKMTERFITTHGQKTPMLLMNLVVRGIIVIVEDFISAIKLHQAGYSVLCLWGTKLDYNALVNWFKFYDICLVWLDNDREKQTNSGQIAADKIVRMGQSILNNKYGFSAKCKNIANIVADEDPKYYNQSEIHEFVQGALR